MIPTIIILISLLMMMGVIILNLIVQLNKKDKPKPNDNVLITTNHLKPVVITHRMQLTKNEMMQDYDPQWTIEMIDREIKSEIHKQLEPMIENKSWVDVDGKTQIESHITILVK
jgi:hypothetical protein